MPEKTKNPKSQNFDSTIAKMLDPKKSLESRSHMLTSIFQSGDPLVTSQLATQLLKKMEPAASVAELDKLKSQYAAALQELEDGGVRPATYIGPADGKMPGPQPRAHVVALDGQQRFPFLHADVKLDSLAPGMTTYLDPKGAVVLGASESMRAAGPQAKFVRRLPASNQVEVSVRDESLTMFASREVLDAADAGELKRNQPVLICPQRMFVFAPVPQDNNREHRFVDRGRLPNVLPHRDIGDPHSCLGWLLRRTSILMFRPDLVKRFDQRPRVSILMSGPSGTGKTLTIKAYLTLFGQMCEKRTGRSDIGSRVIRVKMSEQLSEWLGRSEKNWDSLFDDIQELAAQEIVTADGETVRLPVVVILEEVEGVARRRSSGNHDGTGGAMDRILGTLLQRLDDPTDELAGLPLVIISTSNRPSLIDVAMHRRLGAKVARFKRLDRQGLAAVLEKKVKPDYEFARRNGEPKSRLRRSLIDEVVANLFDPENDAGILEITLGDGTRLTKFPREFLTGAVVEQALSEANDQLTFEAAEMEFAGIGLDSARLIESLRHQIDALAENVTAYNAADYVDVPEHTQVTNVRRFRSTNGHLSELVRHE